MGLQTPAAVSTRKPTTLQAASCLCRDRFVGSEQQTLWADLKVASEAEQDMVLFAATAALRLESHLCTGASARVEPRHVDDAV